MVTLGLASTCLLTPAAVAGPTPTDPGHAPAVRIVAPVVEIRAASADLEGYATVEVSGGQARVRLDSTLLFNRDSAQLRPAARRRILELGRTIRVKGPGAITVTGYTDDLGTRAHGVELSRRRAAAVAGALKQVLPADSYTFRTRGRGEADPDVPNTSEANRQKNRRVLVGFDRR